MLDSQENTIRRTPSRRDFVKLAGTSAVLSLGAAGNVPAQAAPRKPAEPLPMVPFGPHKLSRLVVGANPINGGSHLSRFVNEQMKRYFTQERIQHFLTECEAAGINTWQSGPQNYTHYATHRTQGGRLQYISLAKDAAEMSQAVAGGAIAAVHHGEVTDTLFKSGQIDTVKEFLARTRDAGVLAGVSTHMPAVVDYIESKGWQPDFYMTCVYERHRTREELKALLGYVPIPVREVYLEEDPDRMFTAIAQTDRTCLAFKILAAGRLCDKADTVEQAFKTTFERIKPGDAVIVGMYPEYEDQISINAGFTRRYGLNTPT